MTSETQASIQAAERPTWHLQRAVLVYSARSAGPYGFGGTERVYATLHTVEHGKGGAKLSAGVPATREACADLARALGENAKLGGFVPQNLIYLGARSIIWWRPPGPARVFFNCTKDAAGDQLQDKGGAARIGKANGVVNHPGLVFAVAGSHWYVYAVETDGRPNAHTPLWRAPYFNVWGEGEICTGNVRLPETLSPQSLAVYEKAFFDSEFTHPNLRGGEKLIHHADGPYGFWAGLLKRPLDLGFPVQNLVKHANHLNVEKLAKRLEKGGRGTLDE